MAQWGKLKSFYQLRREKLLNESLKRCLINKEFSHEVKENVKRGEVNVYVDRKFLNDLLEKRSITSSLLSGFSSRLKKVKNIDLIHMFTDVSVVVNTMDLAAKSYGLYQSFKRVGIYKSLEIQFDKFRLKKFEEISRKEFVLFAMNETIRYEVRRFVGRTFVDGADSKNKIKGSIGVTNGNGNNKPNGNGNNTNGNGGSKTNGNGKNGTNYDDVDGNGGFDLD